MTHSSTQRVIRPASKLRGTLRLPGDKSISHRYAMLAAIASGESRIRNYSTGADCQSTLACVQALGISVRRAEGEVIIRGRGLRGLQAPAAPLDAGNSGSTIRMMSGILAAQPFVTQIGGDESLSRRPMQRIMKPLAEMGATVLARDGKFPPLEIHGGPLYPIDYTLPVPSAQVKTCILFAGLYADGVTTVKEPVRTRDHSELALREFGAELDTEGRSIIMRGPARLEARDLTVPGDLSSAAFFLAAALMVPGSDLLIQGVGLNPTRSSLIDFLVGIGASIRVVNIVEQGGEIAGDLQVKSSTIRGGVIEKDLTAALIDEIPVLAVLGANSEHGLTVRDAAELRIKETDRIATVADNFTRMGVKIEVLPDGFHVPGGQRFHGATVDSFGDHRIAMAFAVAGLAADGETTINNAEAASVSYPEFYETLASMM
jgi:3-phosphoshikimate 1-carboxyvinyltransferase